ncbi:Ig-like domain-containing protein [Streptomyces longwoodensis]|uniref:Ig-like domain-containing protein n=1 Tax=Streptomyces longwoodensis TaxID=68231 RepID=UPI00225AF3ED|nr:Ig-like domain-containing protein [Streptomyces longwoodensis]MCX4993853.1 Ig-like domain-containing protein [Streptomyces longwoodensis]MCX4998027.1 Ig-like domain-containing protein [Streptomyces longwoodensis]
MAGDPTNANLWTDADVYVTWNLNAPLPASAEDPFGPDWHLVGLLDGDEGFPEGRDEDTDDKYAWGGILVKTSRSHFKLTKSFTCLEDNATTRRLVWPGSTETKIKVPRPEKVKVGFETREGDKTRRLITSLYAECALDGDHGENETDLESATIQATIFPTSGGDLFDRQTTPVLDTITVVPDTLSVADGEIAALAATATYSDASTADVTAEATWTSSAPATATVSAGFVTGVNPGAATVTVTYQGQSDTCAVTVTA